MRLLACFHTIGAAFVLLSSIIAANIIATTPTIFTIWQAPNGTWIENLQVLRNGSVLATTLTHPVIYMIDPLKIGHDKNDTTASIAYTFTNATSTLGIAEIAPDIIAVIAGKMSTTTLQAVSGSWSVHILDFSPLQPHGPQVIATHALPEAGLLNGMTTLPAAPGYLLLADSDLGRVWQLNVYTGQLQYYADPLFAKAPNVTASALNGIRVAQGTPALQQQARTQWSSSREAPLAAQKAIIKDNETVGTFGSTFLYFTNSNKNVFGRMAITREGLPLTNRTHAERLAVPPQHDSYDDLAVAPDGSFALIANWIGTAVEAYDVASGVQTTAAGFPGDVLQLDHPTSVHWANDDLSAVYVSTAGYFGPFGGSGGGQVVVVTLA